MKKILKERIVIDGSGIIQGNDIKDSTITDIESKEIIEKKILINKKIMIDINGIQYKSLSEGMRCHVLLSPLDPSQSKRSPSREEEYQRELKIWNKINREMRKSKDGYQYADLLFKMI